MKSATLLLMSATMTLAACSGPTGKEEAKEVIGKSSITIEGKRMTPEALWAMGRIGSVTVSPDEKQIAYTVSYYSVPENKSNSELFVMNADGSNQQQLTRNSAYEGEPTWIKQGKQLAT